MDDKLKKIDILLIEDTISDAELTIRALKVNNITNKICHLKDGEEAIAYLFPEGGMAADVFPKIIFLDLKLPKVSGIEILKRLKSDGHTKAIPVVMLTSSQEEKDIVESYQLGVNSYVTKPVVFEAFIKAVADVGLYWLLLNQPQKR